MKYLDILNYIKEGYQEDLKRAMRDSLVALKTHGVKTVKISQVIEYFAKKGMEVSAADLVSLLQNDPLVSNVTTDTITFSQDEPSLPDGEPDQEQSDEQTVKDMAKQALKKRL